MMNAPSIRMGWLQYVPAESSPKFVASCIERHVQPEAWREAINLAEIAGFTVDVDYLRQRWKIVKGTFRLSRRSDPETSSMAAESITQRGKRAAHVALIVAAICADPGKTSAELGEIVHLDRVEAARRTSDAMADGLIEQGPKRPCTVCHSSCVTWWPVSRRKTA